MQTRRVKVAGRDFVRPSLVKPSLAVALAVVCAGAIPLLVKAQSPNGGVPAPYNMTAGDPNNPNNYPPNNYPPNNYPQNGAPQGDPAGSPQNGYPQNAPGGYPQGTPQNGYPQNGYPQQGGPAGAPQGYPQNGYPTQNGYPAQNGDPNGNPAGAPNGAANNAPYNDPPSRAARLGLIEGNVTFQPGGVEDWVPASLNRPISTGDRLWADAGARAELNLGSATFRLSGRTNFTFVNLTDTLAQVQVSSGTLDVRVRGLAGQEIVEIDTPQAAFTLQRAGEYRVDVSEQGDWSVATVRAGGAEIASGGQVFPLNARDQVRVQEENGQPVFDRRPAPVADAFDNWCATRDRREDTSPSARYVSREMPGYADLDGRGAWSEQPGYGMVWQPNVPAGWAPYHNGHWAWVQPWGWTWVDEAPWGYAPFHYGRWANVGGAWVWVPGPVVVGVRPVYAPALVGWVGGAGFGVAIGIGPAVGWFPLGPREVWVPPYRYSPGYMTQVNVTNTVIVNRTVLVNPVVANANYMNRGVPGAVTAVPQGAMVAGRPIAGAAVVVPPGAMARAQVGSYAAVAPQRGALVGGQAPSNFAPPAGIANRTMVARATPPPPPVSFNQQQAALQRNPGQPLNQNQYNQIRQTQPGGQGQAPAFRSALPQQQNAPGGTPAGAAGRPSGFGQGQNPGQSGGQNAGQFGGQNGGQAGGRGYQPLGSQSSGQPGGGPANVSQPNTNPANTNQPGNRSQNQPTGVGGNPAGGAGGLPESQARQDVTRPAANTSTTPSKPAQKAAPKKAPPEKRRD